MEDHLAQLFILELELSFMELALCFQYLVPCSYSCSINQVLVSYSRKSDLAIPTLDLVDPMASYFISNSETQP